MNWYFGAIKNYGVFEGRASRKAYWHFILGNIIFTFSLAFIDKLTGTFVAGTGFGILSAAYTLFIIVPGIAVSVRRLHDSGRTGWWFLITIIPALGFLIFLYFMVCDSDPKTNENEA